MTFPVLKIVSTAINKDIRHIVSLEISLEGSLNINSATHGLNVNLNTGFLLVLCSQFLHLCIDFDLTVY